MLDSLFQAMWQQQKGEKQVEHSSSGARVVVAALQSRDKWGRTPVLNNFPFEHVCCFLPIPAF